MTSRINTKLFFWEALGFVWIVLAGSALHYAFEISEYWTPMALIASVNESTWEHLKMYFWPGLLFVLVQYTYVRDVSNNYWFGKAVGLIVMPLAVVVLNNLYLAVSLPLYGRGFLAGDIAVGMLGVMFGSIVSYRILNGRPMRRQAIRLAAPIYLTMLLAFCSFTYFPPKLPLFEHFSGYRYHDMYGILEASEYTRLLNKRRAKAQASQTAIGSEGGLPAN
ncbi:MAG: DUF6512 family protein [bacterium]